jgi:hypothetical protein
VSADEEKLTSTVRRLLQTARTAPEGCTRVIVIAYWVGPPVAFATTAFAAMPWNVVEPVYVSPDFENWSAKIVPGAMGHPEEGTL